MNLEVLFNPLVLGHRGSTQNPVSNIPGKWLKWQAIKSVFSTGPTAFCTVDEIFKGPKKQMNLGSLPKLGNPGSSPSCDAYRALVVMGLAGMSFFLFYPRHMKPS